MTTKACIVTSKIVDDLNLDGVVVDNSRNYAIVKKQDKVLVEVFSTDSGLTMIETAKGENQAYNTNDAFIREAIEESVLY